MDKRTKILASLFGVVIVYALFSQVVYPHWIEKWLTLDERIAKRRVVLDRLEAVAARVEGARYAYRSWVGRAGSFDAESVAIDVRDRINKLIEKHGLKNAKVSQSRPSSDRKTGLIKSTVTVSATGTLPKGIAFLRDLAELPYLTRIGAPSLSPAGSSGRGATKDTVNIRVPVEVWILPQHRIVGRLEPKDIERPDKHVHHAGRDYSRIWSGEPFQEYVPLRVEASPKLSVLKGTSTTLDARVDGGLGGYTFSWMPKKGLSSTTIANPRVDTETPRKQNYTLTVTDAFGHTATAKVAVTVRDTPPPTVATRTREIQKPPPEPDRPKPWSNGRQLQICMALLRRIGDTRVEEVMVHNSQSNSEDFYKVGDDFDGGELVFVHQTGGVVRRSDDYFIYPLGETLDNALTERAAGEYPVLLDAVKRHRKAYPPPVAPAKDAKADDLEAKGVGGERDGDKRGQVKPTTRDGKPSSKNPKATSSARTNEAVTKSRDAAHGPGAVSPKDSQKNQRHAAGATKAGVKTSAKPGQPKSKDARRRTPRGKMPRPRTRQE